MDASDADLLLLPSWCQAGAEEEIATERSRGMRWNGGMGLRWTVEMDREMGFEMEKDWEISRGSGLWRIFLQRNYGSWLRFGWKKMEMAMVFGKWMRRCGLCREWDGDGNGNENGGTAEGGEMKNGCLAKEMCSDGSLYSIDPLLLLLFRPFIDFLGGGISADCCNSTPRVGFCLVLFFNPAQQPTVGQLLQMLRERGKRPSILLEYASLCFQALRGGSRHVKTACKIKEIKRWIVMPRGRRWWTVIFS